MNTDIEIETIKYFDMRQKRLMLSLGALSKKKPCTYSCPFCYVHSPNFKSYVSMSIDEIVSWVRKQEEPFDIIYVSGDTDSFAKPRTEQGLELLAALTDFDVDLLFTTRALFTESHLTKLASVKQMQDQKGRLLIGCVSISQLNQPYLEPPPISSPHERAMQLKRFRELGLATILALRPFLPVVPLEDYLDIVDSVKGFVHIVLGSNWYADEFLETKVFQGKFVTNPQISRERMDFDVGDKVWNVYKSPTVEDAVQQHCNSLNIPFFMRSQPAIAWLRSNSQRSSSR